jgi:ABC-type uncharacterized transport system permease subunit
MAIQRLPGQLRCARKAACHEQHETYTVRVILSTASFQLPALWATAPALISALAYLIVIASPRAEWRQRLLLAAWVLHGFTVAAHLGGLAEATPGVRFGFAPVLSLTAWLVLAVYAVESRFMPMGSSRRGLAALGLFTVVLTLLFPGDERPLSSSPWAPLHWILGIASYALFGAAVLHAALLDRSERALRKRRSAVDLQAPGIPLLRLEALTFHFVSAGFVTLSLAIALGFWFAAPWRWDHKAVFSLLGWLVLGGLLGGRHAFGWRGRLATRWLYVGSGLLLLAYAGSRFVFEVLLHRAPGGGGS